VSKRWPDKNVIGLTGNIATGKSAVMDMAAEKGALTLDADQVVHHILHGDDGVQTEIALAFGVKVRKPDGSVDRDALAAIVFKDPVKLKRLEQIVHPAVRRALLQRIDESPADVVVIEAIKLLEGALADECDQIWVTRCALEKQIERLMVCRGMDRDVAMVRVKAQAPQEEKVARADVVIDTNGTMADTRAYFELAWRRLVQEFIVRSAQGSDGLG
jgi:dephospho-CoA kinase